jgi:hypothetical protein
MHRLEMVYHSITGMLGAGVLGMRRLHDVVAGQQQYIIL